MKLLRMLSLCAGIGGADLAAEWTGAIEIVGQVELDSFCQQVLTRHWPRVKRLSDLREVQGDEFGNVELVVAGFPCQPHSQAGLRRGSLDERDLWPEIRRLLGATRPRWFVGENVSGLLSVEHGRFFGSLLADLVALGYRVGWGVYGAGEIGAPHRRERLFLVAYLPGLRSGTWRAAATRQQGTPDADCVSPPPTLADPHCHRRGEWAYQSQYWPTCPRTSDAGNDGAQGVMADANGAGWEEQHAAIFTAGMGYSARRDDPFVEDTSSRRWEISTNPARTHDQLDASVNPSDGFVSQSRLGRVLDGISARLDSARWPSLPGAAQQDWEPPRVLTGRVPRWTKRPKRLKALGNAIVPSQIYPLFQWIVDVESEEGSKYDASR